MSVMQTQTPLVGNRESGFVRSGDMLVLGTVTLEAGAEAGEGAAVGAEGCVGGELGVGGSGREAVLGVACDEHSRRWEWERSLGRKFVG